MAATLKSRKTHRCPFCGDGREPVPIIPFEKGGLVILKCLACKRRRPVPSKRHRRKRGIACPKCGEDKLVAFDTTYRKGATVRKRRCTECEHEIRTVERVENYATSGNA